MAHQWRHTKMLKRFARFLKGGADTTADGELALVCRSCPIPGVNLPENWRDLPWGQVFSSYVFSLHRLTLSFSWLYAMYLAQDANFCLSNRAGKSAADDPPLQPGSAFMIDPALVASYVKDFIHEKEVRVVDSK
jgi:hypothetical protein